MNEEITAILTIQAFLRQRKSTWEKQKLMFVQKSIAVFLQKILHRYQL